MEEYFLWEKGQKIHFQLPKTWRVLSNVVLESEKIERTIYQMVSESITNPIGTLPLKEIIKPSDKVVIIVDDFARPTPKREILTCLIDHLVEFGIRYDQIDVLFGIGTHRPLSETEVEEALGRELIQKIRYTNHDCWSDKLVSVGRLKTGGEIKLNPLLIQADFRIGIGSILPHPMSGFGGGPKIAMPGVCNFEAIREHHIAHMIAKGASIGNIKNNPFYEEICEAARLSKLDFIINAVYNSEEKVKEIVSGHFEKAHQVGVNMSLKEYGVDIDEDADITIVSAFPLDEGAQVLKPLGPATMVTKKGGTVVLAASVRGGKFPDMLLHAFDFAFDISKGDPKRLVLEYLRDNKPIVENAPMDLNCALNLTLLYLSRVNVILVSNLNEEQVVRLGFRYADSLDNAIRELYRAVPQAKVNILPAGGVIVPMKRDMSFN